MAMIDVQDAYRLVPIHPMHHSFLGVTLPFSLASAPALFSSIAKVPDDFLLRGSSECLQALHSALATCEEFEFLLTFRKVEGPTTRLVFLGVGLNST